MNKNEWWGYLHENGSVQVKRYFGKADITAAQESSFVVKYYGPFIAQSRAAAFTIVESKLIDLTPSYGKPYNIASVCKDDILQITGSEDENGDSKSKYTEEDLLLFDDTDMKYLAEKLAQDYVNTLFWSSLDLLFEEMLEQKRRENE